MLETVMNIVVLLTAASFCFVLVALAIMILRDR